MAKWCGNIGYAITAEVEPGYWESTIVERQHFGDLLEDRRKRQESSAGTNDNITLANKISIIADPFVNQNCSNIAYVEVMGTKWKVSDISVQFPRLILTVGEVYKCPVE